MAYLSPLLTLMIAAVKKAANPVIRDFNELEHLQNSVHGDNTFALRSYEKVQKILHEELSKARSGTVILSDGKGTVPAAGSCFLVSPLDGFAGFAHGNPHFAVSVALAENGVLKDAVIYNPITDEMFFAEKGSGAFKEGFRNHERLRISGNKNIDKAIFLCNADAAIINSILSVSPYLMISGSTTMDLAYLAAGKADAVVCTGASPISMAAGMLLVKEAGGYIFAIGDTDIRSENLSAVLADGNLVASNEPLRQKISGLLAKK